jgi:undecaprenyl pyrophosphate phosphatase UppP
MKNYLSNVSPELEASVRTAGTLFFAVVIGLLSGYVIQNYGPEPLMIVFALISAGFLLSLVYSTHLNRVKMERKIDEVSSKLAQK